MAKKKSRDELVLFEDVLECVEKIEGHVRSKQTRKLAAKKPKIADFIQK